MQTRAVYLTLTALVGLVVLGCSQGDQPMEEAAPAPATIAPTATAIPSESTDRVTRATLKDVLQLLPDHVTGLTLDDLSALLSDSELRTLAEERHLDYWEDRLEELGIFTEDIATLTGVIAGQSGELVVLSGNLDSEDIKDELYGLGFEEDEYRGTEVWTGEWTGDGGPSAGSVAVGFLSNGMVVIGWPSEGGADEVKDVIRVLERGSGSLHESGSMQRLAESLPDGVSSRIELGCSPWDIRGCNAWGESVEVVDADTVRSNWVLVFDDDRGAGFGIDDVEAMLEKRGDVYELTVIQVGDVIVAQGFVDIADAVARLSSGSVLATPVPVVVAAAPIFIPTTTSTPRPTQTPIFVLATATPKPASAPARAPAAPAPRPAAPAPATGAMMAAPTGKLTIAVQSVNTSNGLPRFCTAGCSETIYMSGITDVLFNSKLNADGTISVEPMLAIGFTLDPSLEFGDFTLRRGVQFHDGWGEMTAEDIAFSYNDANSVTNPESIHGQAADFAPLIASMRAVDKYTLRLNYRNFDSRGVLHGFSRFWQTAGVVSKAVFDQTGVEGMQNIDVGVGAFKADEWSQNKGIFVSAFIDYYARGEGNIGPHVQKISWLEVPEGASRRAMLETEEAQISQIATKDIPTLVQKGFRAQKGGAFNTIRNISFVGNYWDRFSGLTGAALERGHDTSKPWIGDPFENGPNFDPNTASMVNSRMVRNGLAFAIDRKALLENLIGGLGFVNHQPYLSTNNPNYRDEWSWGTDFGKARSLLAEAGYGGGFEMDLWVGTLELGSKIGESVGAAWQRHLNVRINLIKTAYSTYRPGLVSRTSTTPGVNICGDENKSNFPYDWAHGFVVSSISAGGYGVGQEIPYATATYLVMAGEPDVAKRRELAANFYEQNRFFANCVGIFEEPIWPMYNSDLIGSWDMRPMANENLGTINNVRTITLK